MLAASNLKGASDNDTLKSLLNSFEAQIRLNGEQAVRERLAKQRHSKAVSATLDNIREFADRGESEQARKSAALMTSTPPEAFTGTLEDSAASEISNNSLLESDMQASIAGDVGFLPTDIVQEDMAKAMMLNNAAEKIAQRQEERGFIGSTIDILMRFIPFYDSWQANKIAGETVEGKTKFGTIKNSIELIDNMSPLEFSKYLDELLVNTEGANLSNVEEFFADLQEEEFVAATQAGAIEALDASIIGAPLVRLAKLAKNGTALLKASGGRELSVGTLEETYARASAGLVDEAEAVEAIEGVLASGLVPTETLIEGIPTKIAKRLQANQGSIQNIKSTVVTERLTPEQIKVATELTKQELLHQARFKTPELMDFNVSVDSLNQVRTASIRFGNENRGYTTKSNATRAARNTYKYKNGSYEITQDANGLHFIELKRQVTETGVQVSELGAYIPSDYKKVGIWDRYVLSADSTSEEITRISAHMSAAAQASIQAQYGRLLKNLKGLNKNKRNNLEVALASSEQQQKWMNVKELKAFYQRNGNKISDDEVLSYYTLQQLNDLDWHIRNSEVVKELARRGNRKINIEAPRFSSKKTPLNGIVREGIDVPEERIIFNTENGRVFNKGEMSSTGLKRFLDDGYRIIEPNDLDITQFRNERVEFLLVKDRNFSDSVIDPVQLNYVAGGHRDYAGNWFIKQARRTIGEVTGRVTYSRPFTHNTGDSLRDLEEHTASLERVRLAFIDDTLTDIEKDIAIRAAMPDLDLAQVSKLAEDKAFSTDTPFVVVRDREIPNMLPDDVHSGARSYEHDDVPGAHDWYSGNNRMYYGHKGNVLPDIQGNAAPLVDPYRTASRAMNNSLKLLAFRNYQVKAIERWVETWGAKLGDVGPKLQTPYTRFSDSKLDPRKATKPEIEMAETQRHHINSLLGMKTESAERFEQTMLNFGEWVNRDMGLVKAGNFIVDKKSKDPLTALRGFVFDAKLGFFDVSQLLLQTQTSVAALTIDPVNGFKAFRDVPLLRMALVNGSDEVMSYLAKNGTKLTGTKPEEFREMVDIIKRTGVSDIGTELSILDDMSVPQIYNNPIARGAQTFRQRGRMFFYEGERINKLVGFSMAYKRFRQANPTKKIDQFDIEKIVANTDTFSVNMTRASNAWWQRGVASVPTQFASYQARLLELMLPQKFGGSRALTSKEKSRLAIGQILLYGSASIPPVLGAQTLYENAVEDVVPSEQAERFLRDGIWDAAIFPIISNVALGGPANTDFSARAGLFGNASLITDMWDPDAGFWELVGGAVYSTGDDFLDAFVKMGRLSNIQNSQDIVPITLDVLSDIASVTSTWSRLERGKFAYDTGFYMSKGGRLIAEVNPQEAVLTAFGIPIKQVSDYYDAAANIRDEKKEDSNISNAIRKLNLEAAALYGRGEFAAAERKIVIAKVILMSGTREDPLRQQRILRQVAPSLTPAWQRGMEDLYNFGLTQEAERSIERFEETRD